MDNKNNSLINTLPKSIHLKSKKHLYIAGFLTYFTYTLFLTVNYYITNNLVKEIGWGVLGISIIIMSMGVLISFFSGFYLVRKAVSERAVYIQLLVVATLFILPISSLNATYIVLYGVYLTPTVILFGIIYGAIALAAYKIVEIIHSKGIKINIFSIMIILVIGMFIYYIFFITSSFFSNVVKMESLDYNLYKASYIPVENELEDINFTEPLDAWYYGGYLPSHLSYIYEDFSISIYENSSRIPKPPKYCNHISRPNPKWGNETFLTECEPAIYSGNVGPIYMADVSERPDYRPDVRVAILQLDDKSTVVVSRVLNYSKKKDEYSTNVRDEETIKILSSFEPTNGLQVTYEDFILLDFLKNL